MLCLVSGITVILSLAAVHRSSKRTKISRKVCYFGICPKTLKLLYLLYALVELLVLLVSLARDAKPVIRTTKAILNPLRLVPSSLVRLYSMYGSRWRMAFSISFDPSGHSPHLSARQYSVAICSNA